MILDFIMRSATSSAMRRPDARSPSSSSSSSSSSPPPPPPSDSGGEPDPYVVVEVCQDAKPKGKGTVLEKFKSSVKKDAVVPVTFEETFVLCRKLGIAGPKIGARAKVVRVHVWEYNRLKDRAYGYFDIDLAQFRNNRSMSLDHAQLKVYKKGNTSSKHIGVLELPTHQQVGG